MSFIEEQKGWYRLVVKYKGQKFQKALDTQSKKHADELCARADENLRLLRRGRLAYIPGEDDLITVLLSDGKLTREPFPEKRLTLAEFLASYQAANVPGKEESTAYTEKIHIKHLLNVLGKDVPVLDVPTLLQKYVQKRSEDGKSQVTIRKELGTLSSIWNRWGLTEKKVPGPLSLRNLQYDKKHEKPPFQTWKEIERQTKDPESALWDSLYLTLGEIAELLTFVRDSASYPFLFPMFLMATDTGARRSEMLRSQVHDIDFEQGIVRIREKKKDRTRKETYRHVPMTRLLKTVMQDWLKRHPGGVATFCREAGVTLTPQLAHHHLKWVLDESKWKVIRGWHCFRHSFISNLAANAVDERIIMKLAGHLNPETTRRYAHLFPSTVRAAVDLVFGKRPAIAQLS